MKIPDIEVKDLLLKLKEASITIEDYWLLCLVYLGKVQNIATYLSIKGTYTQQFFKNLQEKGFLEEIHGSPTLDKLKLTDKFAEIFITGKIDPVFIEFIEKYRSLWPVGIKSYGIYPVRADKNICIKKMREFFKKYSQYSQEDVLKATKLYIDESAKNFHGSITTCNYFIEKEDRGSILASYCELLGQVGEIGKNDFSSKDI